MQSGQIGSFRRSKLRHENHFAVSDGSECFEFYLAIVSKDTLDCSLVVSLRTISSALEIQSMSVLMMILRQVAWPEGFLENTLAKLL